MSSYVDFFKGKRVTVLGLGLLGRGVGDAAFLAECGAQVVVTDKKSAEELAESVAALKKYPNIIFHLGGHSEDDFIDTDIVLKAAGVPLDSPFIAAARKAGVPVYMSSALAAKFANEAGAIVVGITGTRGKSTVAHMLYHVLKSVGASTHLGGNVRGISTLAMLPSIKKGDVVVLELDSWQLQGFGDLKFSPRIAIFSNLMPDHLNYYGGDMETYFNDKANIFRYQTEGALIVGESVAEKIQAANPPLPPEIPGAIPAQWKLLIPGEHNRAHAALVAAALRHLGIAEPDIQKGIESFPGVEGRLQFVREVNGVKIYNDNSATTPEATIAALRAIGDPARKNIVLIIGGDDKRLDMSKLIEEIPTWCSKVVMFKERGTDTIRDEMIRVGQKEHIDMYEEHGLPATIHQAFSVAKPGDIVLYSPAFSSFGTYFKNEFDRGDQFMNIVKTL